MQQKPRPPQPYPVPTQIHRDPISGMIGELQASWDLFTDPRVPIYAKALPVLIGLAYLLLPADVLPDPLLGLGQVDDLGLLAVMVIAFRFIAGASIGTLILAGQRPEAAEGGDVLDGNELIETGESSPDDRAPRPPAETFWPEGGQPQGGGGGYQSEPPRINYNIYSPRASGKGYCGLTMLVIALLIVGIVAWPMISDILCMTVTMISPDIKPQFCTTPTPTFTPTPTPTMTPTPTRDLETVIYRLRTMNKLQTVHYFSEKAVVEERRECVLGPETLVALFHGEGIIGIDLQKLTRNAIEVSTDQKRVTLRVPQAELLHAFLDVEKTKVVFYQVPPLCPSHELEMMPSAETRAKSEVQLAASSEELREMAETYGESFLRLFLEELGFEEVEIIFETPEIEAGTILLPTVEVRGTLSPLATTESTSASVPPPTDTPVPPTVTDTPMPPADTNTPVPAIEPTSAETASP